MKKIFSTIALAILLTACNATTNHDSSKKVETKCECPCEHCKDCDCKDCKCNKNK